MKLLDELEMGKWAYHQCEKGNDTKEIRKLITHNEWIYNYCREIKDIEEMWSRITNSDWAYIYCILIKDRVELHKYQKSEFLGETKNA